MLRLLMICGEVESGKSDLLNVGGGRAVQMVACGNSRKERAEKRRANHGIGVTTQRVECVLNDKSNFKNLRVPDRKVVTQ